MNEDIMKQAGFGEEVEKVKAGICPTCDATINMDDFTDEPSLQEYRISGLCQKCQDYFFE